jgi:hypothetical protein
MKVYKLLNLSDGEEVAMYIDGVLTVLVFPSRNIAIEHRDFLCGFIPENKLIPAYFEVIEDELPKGGIKKILWTKD